MTDDIIQEATEAYEQGRDAGYAVGELLRIIKNQKVEIDILIRKKKTLRDEIAEQQAEIERLQKQLKEGIDLSDDVFKIVKSEAYREFADKVKKISKEVTVPYIADTTIQEHKTGMFWYTAEGFDNLLKELTEKNDKE